MFPSVISVQTTGNQRNAALQFYNLGIMAQESYVIFVQNQNCAVISPDLRLLSALLFNRRPSTLLSRHQPTFRSTWLFLKFFSQNFNMTELRPCNKIPGSMSGMCSNRSNANHRLHHLLHIEFCLHVLRAKCLVAP